MGFKLECVCCINALSNERVTDSQYDFKVVVASVSKLYVNNVLMIHFHLLDIYMYNKGLLTSTTTVSCPVLYFLGGGIVFHNIHHILKEYDIFLTHNLLFLICYN